MDVRSAYECDNVGKVKGGVNVPYVNLKRVYNAETQQKDVVKTPNPDFIKLVSSLHMGASAWGVSACDWTEEQSAPPSIPGIGACS